MAGGCGGDPLPTPTATLPSGSTVEPRVYLADSARAAGAARSFMATLRTAQPELTPAETRLAAADLRRDADAVGLASSRIAAARLQDARLEQQRQHVGSALGRLAPAMAHIADLAERGDARGVVDAMPGLATAVRELRAAGG